MIETTSFLHGRNAYHYRTHTEKMSALLKDSFAALGTHLKRLHTNCPNEPFAEDPRASQQRFHHRIKLEKHSQHARCKGTLKGLELNSERYKTPHSKVCCWMLENDKSTFAIEVPVWTEIQEVGVPLNPPDSGRWLSGHIDALAIENGVLWIWDFKPHADREVWAVGQLTLYARMLSYQTGIPMSQIMCGYFDSEECYTFAPSLSSFSAAKERPVQGNESEVRTPRPVLSKEQRLAQKPPDLSKRGIRKPHASMTDTEFYTWHLFVNEKKSVREISVIRQISEDAVFTHLSSMIRLKVVRWENVLPSAVRTDVLKAFKIIGEDADQPLNGIFNALGERVSYGLIRCALASK